MKPVRRLASASRSSRRRAGRGPRALPALICLVFAAGPLAGPTHAQEPAGSDAVVPHFEIARSPVELRGQVRPREYLGVVSPRAAWLGRETGDAEIWVHPLKLAREFRLAFQVPEYLDPIPGASVARTVTVRPEMTTITYVHASFTVREHLLAPRDEPGILVLLDVETARPLRIVVQFQPILQLAWPGGFGGQYLFWDAERRAFVLSESLRRRNAVIGSPWATEATSQPAHKLADAPATFVIAVDSARARREMIPIAAAGGLEGRDSVWAAYHRMIARAPELYRESRAWADSVLASTVSVDTPDDSLDLALEWSKVNLEEQRVCNPDLGCGLVAGWGPSGSSYRPGFGWFFGGDAAINSLAMDAVGQWALVAEGLRFLARYQREDGKMPHEISQAAKRTPWFEEYPYPYYHADTTPWWMAALREYWKASGDTALVRELWPAYRKAWDWYGKQDGDGDGIPDNTRAGLAAIEVGALGEAVHQDVYLAAVSVAALEGTVDLAAAVGDEEVASGARATLARARGALDGEYFREDLGHHAFAVLESGRTNDALTAWPAAAATFGLLADGPAEATLRKLATDSIAADWGARMLSRYDSLYDPLHYNGGTIWPFVTGFVAMGQYRYRRPWAGEPLVEAVKRAGFDWARGRWPELLSGRFYSPLDETVPHQFFAASMLAAPLVRGLWGWAPDAPAGRAVIAPQLPVEWDRAAARGLPVGAARLDVSVERTPAGARLRATARKGETRLTWRPAIPAGARDVRAIVDGRELAIPSSADARVELGRVGPDAPREAELHWRGGLELGAPSTAAGPGDASDDARVVGFAARADGWEAVLDGPAGGEVTLPLRGAPVRVTCAGPLAGPCRPVDPDAAGSGDVHARVEAGETGAGRRSLRIRFPTGHGDRPVLRVRLAAVPRG